MTPTRPYLVRAFYEWIVDNNCTPHIVVNASTKGIDVPKHYVENGQIVLNVAMDAVQALLLGNDAISFEARFNGIVHHVYVPIGAVMAIYARENGRGMVFAEEFNEQPPPNKDNKGGKGSASGSKGKGGKSGSKRAGGRPHLTVVK